MASIDRARLGSLTVPAPRRWAILVLVIKYGRAEGLGTGGPEHTLGRLSTLELVAECFTS